MVEMTINYHEEMVGANHPTKTDTLNRLALVEHNTDGTHKALTQVTDPYVDVRAYASLTAAVTAIGSSVKTLLIPNTQAVASNLTIPANITLRFVGGGTIAPASGVTVTINGVIDAGPYQIFSGDGICKPSYFRAAYANWWGNPSGVSNDNVILQKALDWVSGGGSENDPKCLKIHGKWVCSAKMTESARHWEFDGEYASFITSDFTNDNLFEHIGGGTRHLWRRLMITHMATGGWIYKDDDASGVALFIMKENRFACYKGVRFRGFACFVEQNHFYGDDTSAADPNTYFGVQIFRIDSNTGATNCNVRDNYFWKAGTGTYIDSAGGTSQTNTYERCGVGLDATAMGGASIMSIGDYFEACTQDIKNNGTSIAVLYPRGLATYAGNFTDWGSWTTNNYAKMAAANWEPKTFTNSISEVLPLTKTTKQAIHLMDYTKANRDTVGRQTRATKLSPMLTAYSYTEMAGKSTDPTCRGGLKFIQEYLDGTGARQADFDDVWVTSQKVTAGTAIPASGLRKRGDIHYNTTPSAGGTVGWSCVNRQDTTIRIQANATDTTIEVTSTAGMLATDNIGIVLDNGTYHWTAISSITDGDTLVITSGIPAGRYAAVGAAVYTHRWKTFGAITA